MLDERKAHILRAVVEEYIETAQPVGSAHVARAASLQVSSATVRNDMVVLEQEGYLTQPHTSAGRVPTDKGYRWFVDHLDEGMRSAPLDAAQVRTFFERAHGELEEMLLATSRLLSDLTHYAAVVVGPPHSEATVRSVQLVGLAPRVALVVVVLSNGVIEKHTLEFDEDTDDAALTAATVRLSELLVGTVLSEAAQIEPLGPAARDAIVRLALDVLGGVTEQDAGVFTSGASGLASSFDAVAQVSEVLRVLEQQYVVVTLMRDVLDRGLSVAIGAETGLEPLAECSLVVAPYAADGEPIGTIGVLGPSRMHYQQALAAVAIVSRGLGDRLSE